MRIIANLRGWIAVLLSSPSRILVSVRPISLWKLALVLEIINCEFFTWISGWIFSLGFFSRSTYPMAFNFINGCSNGASCTVPNCAGAFTDPTNGQLYQCSADNCGVSPNSLLQLIPTAADVHVVDAYRFKSHSVDQKSWYWAERIDIRVINLKDLELQPVLMARQYYGTFDA